MYLAPTLSNLVYSFLKFPFWHYFILFQASFNFFNCNFQTSHDDFNIELNTRIFNIHFLYVFKEVKFWCIYGGNFVWVKCFHNAKFILRFLRDLDSFYLCKVPRLQRVPCNFFHQKEIFKCLFVCLCDLVSFDKELREITFLIPWFSKEVPLGLKSKNKVTFDVTVKKAYWSVLI